MATVMFYHQVRVDGGRRSGIFVDREGVLSGFVPGEEERDPALAWYADVTLETPTPPTEANAPLWLAKHGEGIRSALTEAAGQIDNGAKVGHMPWEWVAEGPRRVSVSVMGKKPARNLAANLRRLANADWTTLFPATAPVG